MTSIRPAVTGLIVGLFLISASCGDPTVPTALPVAPSRVADPAQLQEKLERLAERIARAMGQPGFRGFLKTRLDESPFREHKVHFQGFARLDHARHALGPLDADSLMNLELYIPVAAHRAAWSGDGNILVATSLRDADAPVAFDPQGRRYVLDRLVPPPTPVLALVPAETDFRRAPSRVMYCEDCGSEGGGGGGGGDGTRTLPLDPGIYMTYSALSDLGEGFLRGSPELEVCLIGRTLESGPSRVGQAGQCARDGTYPFHRAFNQEDHTWSGQVMLASEPELDAIAALYPGVPRDSVPFMLQMWEDDTDAGVIYAPDHLSDLVESTMMITDGILLVQADVFLTRIGFLAAVGGWLIVQGFHNFLGAFFSTITGGGDDYVGLIADAHKLYQSTAITSATPYAVMRGQWKNGEVRLEYHR